MLQLDELRDLVARGDIETVVVGFTDHYGRLLGKRFDAEMFVDDIVEEGAHACDYLLTTDMEMEPVPGYNFASWELGYGDFHLVPDFRTLRIASWLEKSAFVLCDLKNEKTHEYVAVAPRSILRRQLDAAQALGYQRFAASGARALPLPQELSRSARAGLSRSDARRLVSRGLSHPPGHAHRRLPRGGPTASKASGVPVENLERRMGPGPARSQRALRRSARHGRPPRRVQAMHEGARRRGGLQRDFHGEVHLRPGRLELPHPFQPLARRAKRVSRETDPRPGAMLRRFPLVSRRLDRARARRHGVLRADDQLLQALRRRLVGADAARVELRQPHRRFSRRRRRARACASNAAFPAPTAIPISPSQRPSPRASTASGIASSRPTTSAATSTPRATCRACRLHARRSGRPLRGQRFREARVRRRRRRALPPLLPHRAERLQLRGDGLGARLRESLFREKAIEGNGRTHEAQRQSRTDHRRRQRHRPRVGAALRARRRGGRRGRRERSGRSRNCRDGGTAGRTRCIAAPTCRRQPTASR